MPLSATLQLRAAARVEDERLVIDYAVTSSGGPPALVCHLDWFYGRPHGVVGGLGGRLGEGVAALFFGTVALPPGMEAAMLPRPAASPLAPGGTVEGTLALPLPLVESGAVAIPLRDDPVEPVPLRRLVVAIEVLVDEGGEPKPAPGGGVDVFSRKTPREHLRTVIELPAGVTLLPTPGGISTIAHGLTPR